MLSLSIDRFDPVGSNDSGSRFYDFVFSFIKKKPLKISLL
jgi:hypothetical protein